ncbi:MAG TPA: PilZ domain-containing protein [Pyrinomonadaceae bacterium]|nr:PilZ domain-containing protein [Pyrinomonadaceae bacterium]
MNTERRKAERIHIKIGAHWEGLLSRRDGTIVDVSTEGCFILTSDDVQPKELIRLEIGMPTGRRIFLWGEVVYQVHEMGFALRFTSNDEAEQKMLATFLEYVRENKAAL